MNARFDIYDLCQLEADMARLAHRAHGTPIGAFYADAANNMAARIHVAARMYADETDVTCDRMATWARRNDDDDNRPARLGAEM